MTRKPPPTPAACPCGSGQPTANCCLPVHAGAAARDAAALMRSRYTAYVLGDVDYLLRSWHPSTRPEDLTLEADPRTWLGLKLHAHIQTTPDQATVEFVARYRIGGGSARRFRERSRFCREQGHWYYLDGDVIDE